MIKQKRNIAALLLTIVVIFSFSACGSREAVAMGSGDEAADTEELRPKEEMVTIAYPAEEVQAFAKMVNDNQSMYTLSSLRYRFTVECTRTTSRGSYTVLLQDDGKWVFFFAGTGGSLFAARTWTEFPSKHDFDEYVGTHKVSSRQMKRFDPNYLLFPINAVDVTAHIVKEGVLVYMYYGYRATDEEGNIMYKRIVKETQLYSNQEFEENPELWIGLPIVYSIDKGINP